MVNGQFARILGMLILILQFWSSAMPAQAFEGKKAGLVVEASSYALQLKSGDVISLHDLVWMRGVDPWTDIVGKKIRFDNANLAKNNKNRYGDDQGRIESDQLGWLQEYWIEQGFAVLKGVDHYPADQRFQLLKAEEKARQSNRGIWQNDLHFVVSSLPNLPDIKGFKIIEGRVLNVRTVRGVTYLNFGQDWRQDFTAAIEAKNRPNFLNEGWKLKELTNKWIRVRGHIRHYNGPFMELILPEQVELLDR